MIRKMYEYRIIPKNDENLFKSYLCFYAESTLSHKVDDVARNRANTMAFMMFGRYHIDYDLELVRITEVESNGTNSESPTCETCYWFDDYVCTRLNCPVRLVDQICWNYRDLALEVLKDESNR